MRPIQSGKLPVLCTLEGNPQPETEVFRVFGRIVEKRPVSQVTPYEQVTTEIFGPDFFLT